MYVYKSNSYAHMHICICICLHTQIYVYMYEYKCKHTHIYIYIHIYIHIHICIYVYIHVYVYVYVDVCVCKKQIKNLALTYTLSRTATQQPPHPCQDAKLKQIRDSRGYNYADIITCSEARDMSCRQYAKMVGPCMNGRGVPSSS